MTTPIGTKDITLQALGTYDAGVFDDSAAEIVSFDPASQRLFVVNASTKTIDVLDASDPENLNLVFQIDLGVTGGPNSVAVKNGIVAVAIEDNTVTENGVVALYDTDGNLLQTVTVGALPDMLVFTPDGSKILVANEGEPDGGVDPVGSVSIIDISGGTDDPPVETADFSAFDGMEAALKTAGVRLFDGKSVSEDVEPEFITISPDGTTAFVALQEANSIAVLDIASATITDILPLGAKDFSTGGGLDPSDRDGGINIANHPVFGLYMPDGIASYDAGGNTYFVTANEGDDRGEDVRIGDVTLDPTVFPNAAALQDDAVLGRLGISSIDGDDGGDGDYEALFSYGARSFSIWDSAGNLIFDSGDDFARITADAVPDLFNSSDGDPGEFDKRSDNKGAEPEAVAIGEIDGETYAFVGLERTGGVMIYNISDPANAFFVDYINNVGDIGPEGIKFVEASDSPTGTPGLVVANEVSSTTTWFEIQIGPFAEQTGDGTGDTLTGDNGVRDLIDGRGGDDSLEGLGREDTLFGSGGQDTLLGGRSDDSLDGGRGDDSLKGGGGEDVLIGGNGQDELFGGSGDDTIKGGKGDDTLNGGGDNDWLAGQANNDLLIGNGGDDMLFGGGGDDTLVGLKGDDTLDGGNGADRFEYAANAGNDVIVDFEIGVDTIAIAGLVTDFAALSISQTGSDTFIDLSGDGTTITLTGINSASLSAGDFDIT